MVHSKHLSLEYAIQKSLSNNASFRYSNSAVSVLNIGITGIVDIKCYYKDNEGNEHQIEASDFEKAEYGSYSCYAMVEIPDMEGGSITQEYILENIHFEVVSHIVNDGKDCFEVKHTTPINIISR